MKIVAFLLLLISPNIFGQKIDNTASFRDLKSNNYIRLHYDNDVFTKTDYNYTQGLNIEFVSAWLKKNPLNAILISPKNKELKYGLAFEHICYTAKNLESFEIQYGDRPFAAALMFKSFLIATDTIQASRISSSITIGVIGPAAFGDFQRKLHKVIDSGYPNGWYYQIKNDVVLNYEISYEKQLLRLGNAFSLQANTTIKAGTLFTNASAGLNASLGIINSPFTSLKNSNKFQLYIYSQPLVNVIGYDATLQGGLFNDKSPYTIPNSDIERFTLQNNFGIVLYTGRFYFEYSHTLLTREISTAPSHNWGGFRIGY